MENRFFDYLRKYSFIALFSIQSKLTISGVQLQKTKNNWKVNFTCELVPL